jgi:hypothetical protein
MGDVCNLLPSFLPFPNFIFLPICARIRNFGAIKSGGEWMEDAINPLGLCEDFEENI